MSYSAASRTVLRLIMGCFIGIVVACKDSPSESNEVILPPNDGSLSYSMLSSLTTATDTIIRIRVSWVAPNDPFGLPEFYRHTMTASKTVTDLSTGPLPTLKQVNGLVDTIRIKLNLVNDTVTLTSNVWSVRRGLQSTTPAVGKLFIRRGDRAPLPPDSIKVDTIVVPSAPSSGNISSIVLQANDDVGSINNQTYNSMFGNYKNGVSVYKTKNVTYLTIASY